MQINRKYILLFHLIIVGPLLIYITRTKESILYKPIIALGTILAIYHLYCFYKNYVDNKFINYINLIHIIFIAPLLIYLGIKKHTVIYPTLDIIAILGAGVMFHSFIKLIK